MNSTHSLIEASNISEFERTVFDSMRTYFKRVHELLYEAENKRTQEIEEVFRAVFGGKRVNLEEIRLLQGVGEKHGEVVGALIGRNRFVEAVKE